MSTFNNPQPSLYTEAGTPITVGTTESDVFNFTDGPMFGGKTFVVGNGGGDTFNGGLNAIPTTYYSFDPLFDDNPEYWKSGKDVGHGGEGDAFKLSFGADSIFAHGGGYHIPLEAFVRNNDRVHIAGEEDVLSFETDLTRADRDGEGFTSRLNNVLVEGDAPYNPGIDGQLVLLRLGNTGHYIRRDGTDAWRPIKIDHDSAEGPTEAEVQAFVDEWPVVV